MEIKVTQGDITKLEVDAIVNAANTSLMGGGGVDGAIHRAGGPAILEDCMKIRDRQGGCPTGEAVITTAGNMPATYVIHTVGPVWNGGKKGEPELLANCYINSIKLANENGITSIAFPNISTGIYGYPKRAAAEIAINTVKNAKSESSVTSIIFCCFDFENYQLYHSLLND